MVLDNVRRICAELGISIAEACRRSGVPRDTVMDWTDDHKPNGTNLIKMAKALGVDPEELLKEGE